MHWWVVPLVLVHFLETSKVKSFVLWPLIHLFFSMWLFIFFFWVLINWFANQSLLSLFLKYTFFSLVGVLFDHQVLHSGSLNHFFDFLDICFVFVRICFSLPLTIDSFFNLPWLQFWYFNITSSLDTYLLTCLWISGGCGWSLAYLQVKTEAFLNHSNISYLSSWFVLDNTPSLLEGNGIAVFNHLRNA